MKKAYLSFPPIEPTGYTLNFLLSMLCLCLSLSLSNVATADKPLWELGGGLVYVSVHSYPGSHHKKNYTLPAPVLHYRGERLRIDRDSVYTPLFKSERIHIKVSADGTPPVDSDDLSVRNGMPDLDATIQMGPSIEILLNKTHRKQGGKWTFKIPLRMSIATDLSHVDDRGLILNPKLNYKRKFTAATGPFSTNPLDFRFTIATLFANRRYLEYYYGVDAAFVTADRPSYQPASGYAGSYLSIAFSQKRGPWMWSAYTRVKWLNGSTFESSPLMETNQEKQLGIVLIYTFAQSLQRVSN